MPEKFALLFGPYWPPQTSRGKFLVCERRGKVKVGGYSDGPIPWPIKFGAGPSSIILCGDLVRAVKLESASTVARHWGVSTATVKQWRKVLEVEFYNAGTRYLQHMTAAENFRPSHQRRMTEAARRHGSKPKSRQWRRYMSMMIKVQREAMPCGT